MHGAFEEIIFLQYIADPQYIEGYSFSKSIIHSYRS